MYIYKVKTAELTPHLPKMQVTHNNEASLLRAGLDVEEAQLLKKTIPCGLKILAARDRYGMEMGTVRCGNHNIDLGTTELCDACHAVFEDVSGETRLTVERLGDMVQAKPLSHFEKCKKFAKDHPYLSAAAVIALIAFPVVCGLMAYGLADAKPNYSVDVKKATTSGDKDTVTLTTRVVAPKNCYTVEDVSSASGGYSKKIKNNCNELLLVTPMKESEVICVIELEQTKVCDSSSAQLSYYSGSRSIKFIPDEKPSVEAKVTQQGDLTIFLPDSTELTIPTTSESTKAPTTSEDTSQTCIEVKQNTYSLNCVNKCNETVLLSVFKDGKAVERFPMEYEGGQIVDKGSRLTENKNIPTVIQKPAF